MNVKAIEREQRVFRSFAENGPLAIDLNSIESPPPPAPDILCRVERSEFVAFELVELVDEEYARGIVLMARTHRILRDLPERLPADLRGSLKEFGDPYIAFDFVANLPLRAREQAAVDALRWLLNQESGRDHYVVEGNLRSRVEAIHVHRPWRWGLKFESSSAGFVGDPTLVRLESKFGKTYKSEHPIELLMYTEIDLIMPDDIWRPTVEPFVQERLAASPFRRVWLYKVNTRLVEYVHPALGD